MAIIKTLVKKSKLPAYQIGGMYLRFRVDQLEAFKEKNPIEPRKKIKRAKESSAFEGLRDFFYFNDFYILAVLIIISLLFIILRNIG